MKYSFVLRTKVVSFFILISTLVLIGKLFLVQVVHSDFYSEQADRQYSTPSSGIFERGTIFFERKDGQLVSAATQTAGFKVAVNPGKIIDREKVYQELSQKIALDYDNFISKAEKINDPYEETANHLSKEEADSISALKIPGVSVFKEKWRFYPGGSLASQTLGFVAYKDDDLGGRYGLERQYDNILSRDENNPYVNFFAEVFSNINDTFFKGETLSGDVVTTIEPLVQSFLEKTLASVKERYRVDSIGGIIMDPKSGSIYALASKPDFDLNNFSKVKTASVFSNPIVENVFEFGSVVKPLVMAGGLDGGGGAGANTFKDKTGIDLPNETSGLVSKFISSPRDIEYTNAAFGQGIALTPIEMIRALASLSNGGNLVVPHIAQKIKYENGAEREMAYSTSRVKISESTSQEITRMLVIVMDKLLQGKPGELEHYSVAAKTGTAQIANNTEGGYYEDKHIHSFFGYFPAYDPKFIVFLYAIDPKGVSYASQTWTDPFLNITKFLLNYYEIPPDK